jgi:hypothetical protein
MKSGGGSGELWRASQVAIRKRGFRRIVVDSIEYRWKFPRRLTDQEEEQPGVWAVAQRVQPAGALLCVVFPRRHHMSGPHAAEGKPVLPSEIVAGIRAALKAGWQSDRPGKQFRWQVAELQLAERRAVDCTLLCDGLETEPELLAPLS